MIIEDGTGLVNADSFVSVDFADNYFFSRGFSKWQELEQEKKEVALVNATDFINNYFEWKGKRLTANQSLAFPRQSLFDNEGFALEGVPTSVKQAVCEAIKINIDGELYETQESNGAVVSEKIGNLQFSYDVSKKDTFATRYESINKRLKGLYVDKSIKRIGLVDIIRK